MKDFLRMMRRYIAPFKKYLYGSVVLNILSAVFNIFSFAVIVPMLRILFRISDKVYTFTPWNEVFSRPVSQMGGGVTDNLYFLLGQAIENQGASRVLLYLCLFLVVTTAIKTACYFGSAAVMVPIRTGVVKNLRKDLYDKILSLPIGFFSEERKGDIIARMSGDVQEVENSITGSLEMLIKNPILIVFYFLALIAISWQMTLFTIVFAPLMIWVMGVVGRNLKRQSMHVQQLWSDTMAQVEETLSGLRIVKAFNAEKKMSSRFESVTDRMRRKVNRVNTRQASAHPVSEFLGTVMIMAVLAFGGYLIIRGKGLFGGTFMDASQFIFFMIILYSVIEPIKELSRATYGIPKGLASMERINKILEADNPIQECENPQDIKEFKDKITFEGVTFSYESGREVLKGVDLEIPRGKMVAIVGESGAGKSTLVDLIPRFYDATGGRITIDGKDVRDLRIKDLRALMGNVNQDPILFNDTIFNNIAFGVEGATEEQVIAAAKIANAHDFIMEKPEGYQTNIGDRGTKLSGGQRQRLSIARAILKNPPILILDEATASLDTESERIVQDALDRLMSSRTTIAIAHRLSTIKNADEIIVMHDGQVVERGRHEELIALDGYYKRLNDMQAL
ncbi:MAG: ABC transporter ATP-binding protein [Bacteroidales bacterium]|nr:ABC transporter ATP-binding protein [Bacteroidales bacterium]